MIPMPWLLLAQTYCKLYVYIKRVFGKNLRGLGVLTRKINKDHVLMVKSKKFYLNHKVAGSYGTLLTGVWNEPETHIFIRNLASNIINAGIYVNFIDVGANIGEMIVDFAGIENIKLVIGFEPNPECAKACELSSRLNGYKNVKIIQKVLGNGTPVKFKIDFQSPNASRVVIDGNEGELMSTSTLDNELCDLTGASIILVDVEGYEPVVLEGGRKFIESKKPLIIFEYNQTSKKYFNLEKIKQIIGADYKIFRLRQDGYLGENVENSWNCIAVHSESVFYEYVKPLMVS
jgi:FkbM family methyltransferase